MSTVKSIRLADDLQDRLEAFAIRNQRTPNFVIGEAIKTYLEFKEQEEVVIEAAREAWTEFQTQRMGAEINTVTDWLKSWGTPSEQSTPLCRKL